jgi:transposase
VASYLLTEELRSRIERELAQGVRQDAVANRCGVGHRTLRRWIAEGLIKPTRTLKPVEPAREQPPEPPPEPQKLSERIAQAEPGLVGAVVEAAQRGHWQAAAWMLERSFPERWARREAKPEPKTTGPFSEVDELARRRRAQ